MKKVIAIVGPTASGKTNIGARLAKELNGEIISADSRQVFRGLNIGTGKEYISDVRQWLIDVAEPGERFVLFDWLKLTREKIEDIISRGKVPIIVGGTGLYVQALVEGFKMVEEKFNDQLTTSNQEPNSNHQLKIGKLIEGWNLNIEKSERYSREKLNQMTTKELVAVLSTLYPQGYPQVDENNPRRLIRVIEQAQSGQKPMKQKPDFEVLQIAINLPREELYQKIDGRVESRFQEGMLEEIIALIMSGVDREWLLNLGLEYRVIGNFAIKHSPALSKNRIKNQELRIKEAHKVPESYQCLDSLFLIHDSQVAQIADKLKQLPEYEVMKQELKYKIHAFARRQLTWFRRFPDIKWCQSYRCALDSSREYLSR